MADADPRMSLDPARLVRGDSVHRSVYTDPEIFRLEMKRIFGRAWLYLAHESEFAAAGDYVVRHMGDQPVILTRDADGEIHAIYNRCTHRGTTLCAFDRGSAPHGHQCPYHGWMFNADGTLRFIPHHSGYDGVLDKADYAIRQVRLERYRGFIFGNLSGADALPLIDFLGHMRSSIDDLADRSPTGKLQIGRYVLRHHYRANWKMAFENLNDTLHPGFAHAASVVSAKSVAATLERREDLVPTLGMMMANGKPVQFFQDLDMVVAPGGHSYIGGHMGADYTPDTQDEYTARLIAFHGQGQAGAVRRPAPDAPLSILILARPVSDDPDHPARPARPDGDDRLHRSPGRRAG